MNYIVLHYSADIIGCEYFYCRLHCLVETLWSYNLQDPSVRLEARPLGLQTPGTWSAQPWSLGANSRALLQPLARGSADQWGSLQALSSRLEARPLGLRTPDVWLSSLGVGQATLQAAATWRLACPALDACVKTQLTWVLRQDPMFSGLELCYKYYYFYYNSSY